MAADASKGSALRLSKRELEVARYLPTPLSSAEIAERLYISLNTLKTHLRTIYGKLGATNRREAIERAEELGIA
jgi:LuxR family maltose regulon positive regulatory protein